MYRYRRSIFLCLTLSILCIGETSWSQLESNECRLEAQELQCSSNAECSDGATVCIEEEYGSGACQIPCMNAASEPEPSLCTFGEACVAGRVLSSDPSAAAVAYYCRPVNFSMDLNLLDSCVRHFIEGPAPQLIGSDECSLLQTLDLMLDRDGNQIFNIYDVDQCVGDYLSQEPCESPDYMTGLCEDGSLGCEVDADCGDGLYCHEDFKRCERECGFLVNRKDETRIERVCENAMNVCDLARGRCEETEVDGFLCSVDNDCPVGAYCQLGQCAPECYRSIDCPGANWICNTSNRCEPLPPTGVEEDFVPENYSVNFATRIANLNPIDTTVGVPAVIMDLVSRRQVFNDPGAVFGYRLEVTYGRKQSDQCYGDLTAEDVPPEVAEACVIQEDQGEGWLVVEAPFGTIYAAQNFSFNFSLNEKAAEKLGPGYYPARITAIFTNGTTASMEMMFHKPAASGSYRGPIGVFLRNENNELAESPVKMTLHFVGEGDSSEIPPVIDWDNGIMTVNNLSELRDYRDLNKGQEVWAVLHGESSLMFNQPSAETEEQNIVLFKGLYSQDTGRVRLIGLTTIESDQGWCREVGQSSDPELCQGMKIINPFGRRVRRVMELIGTIDTRTRSLEGIYRETLQGLLPTDVTFEGNFYFVQEKQHDGASEFAQYAPLFEGVPLLEVGESAAVGFPSYTEIVSGVDSAIEAYCGASHDDLNSMENMNRYLRGELVPEGFDFPLFADLRSFRGIVSEVLENTGAEGRLTLADYFGDSVGFCESASDTNLCISEMDARCGLALHQKALLAVNGEGEQSVPWLPLERVVTELDAFIQHDLTIEGSAKIPMFCDTEALNQPEFCTWYMEDEEAPVVSRALLQHNRFFQELVSVYRLLAGNAVSDAFFTLFRSENGDQEFGAGYALKDELLSSAIVNYDSIRDLVLSPEASAVWSLWPTKSFQGLGSSLLNQTHAALNDRMETLLELFDLKRRILDRRVQNDDALFIDHILHVEYLSQLYLAALQSDWEGEQFSYTGEAKDMLQSGSILQSKVSESRNPVGLAHDRVYFENDDLAVKNWERFYRNITGDGASSVPYYSKPEVQALIDSARDNLAKTLEDENGFNEILLAERQALQVALDDYCGPEEGYSDEFTEACDVSAEEKSVAASCEGVDCPMEYACDDALCTHISQVFVDETGGNTLKSIACRADTNTYKITTSETGRRPCVHGAVGTLMQERHALDLQRQAVVDRMSAVMRDIANQYRYIEEATEGYAELKQFLSNNFDVVQDINADIAAADFAFRSIEISTEALGCLVLFGLANGTDCPQKAASAALIVNALAIKEAVVLGLNNARASAEKEKELRLQDFSLSQEIAGYKQAIDQLVGEVDSIVGEYQRVVQQIYSVDVQIQDTLFQAQRTADRFNESVNQAVDHLIGELRVGPAVRNMYVIEANSRFRRLLVEVYKMVQAYVHYFNIQGDAASSLRNSVYQITNLDDIDDVLDEMEKGKDEYFGELGLDRDTFNNTEIYRVSLRDLLFPNLQPRIDPSTGSIQSVAQQFHNMITSPPYLRKVPAPDGLIEERIEIPFSLWLHNRGDEATSPIPRLFGARECNHILAIGSDQKNVAVEVLMTNRPTNEALRINLGRGPVDHIRSCYALLNGRTEVNIYQTGNSLLESRDSSVSNPFSVQPSSFDACILGALPSTGGGDEHEPDSSCWNVFARDRSLGAPDWTFTIGSVEPGGENHWIFEEASSGVRTIDDIIVYLRHTYASVQSGLN